MTTACRGASCATLQYLNLHSDFPFPEEAPGKPLARYWKSATSSSSLPGGLDIQAKSKFLSQLGAIKWKLSQLRFDEIGSLFTNGKGTGYRIGECLYRVDLWNDFVTVGCKTNCATNRVNHRIVGNALRRLGILSLASLGSPDTIANPRSYPLFHSGLGANNIYVDDEYQITCIIDWAFASTVPEAMLLSPPGLPQCGDRLEQGLKEVDKYRETLRQGQRFWSLTRLLNLDSIDDYSLFSSIWEYKQSGTPDDHIDWYIMQQRRMPYYIDLHSKSKEEDQPITKIRKYEEAYFQNKTFKYTIARKLTFIFGWETQYSSNNKQSRVLRDKMFVADAKLWKWIMQCMQDWEDRDPMLSRRERLA
ncbi:uncharacterized protein BDV14DRAFT_211316 [Aspergillus stella-maris]|uniref:uncharacterized protein n=1 Tax=Aspergillus stella-maris TaxID=1810926 RepID=UPI003CCD3038